MCGIYGELAREPLAEVDLDTAARLTDLLIHRGPDRGAVRRFGPRCILGHRRLTIIDLDARADQPFVSDDGRHAIVYNGELYNYRELRQQLESRGYRHRTASDTEVLLNSYRCWGADVLPRLEGMFAFAIFDTVEQRLFAARDHMGQKPFYYVRTPSRFVFASELRALIEHPVVDPRLSVENFQKYLLYEFYPWDTTPLVDVFKLPPASALTCDATLELHTHRYWDSVPGSGHARRDIDEEVQHLFRDSVQKHLIADVPVGIFLSGGLDSSLVAATAAALPPEKPLETFTVSVGAPGFDESAVAARMAAMIGERHHVLRLDEAETARCAEVLLARLDEPLADPGAVPSFFIAREARDHIKVALTGDGGDELGAGYVTFRALGVDRLVRRLPAPLLGALRRVCRRIPAGDGYLSVPYLLENFLKGYPAPSLLRTQLWIAPFAPAEARALLAGEWRRRALSTSPDASPSVFEDLWNVGRPVADRPLEDQMLYLFQKFYLPEYVCAHTDRMSMQSSLEVRSPFLHRPLVETMNALPFHEKRRGSLAKLPFHRLARRILPRDVVNHPKHGFTFPVGRWLRTSLRPLLERLLAEDRLRAHGLLDAAPVRRMLEDHIAGRANYQKPLWALAVFEHWLETFPSVRLV